MPNDLSLMRLNFLILVTVAVVLAGCSRRPAQVSVANHSGVTISNVWVAGSHFATSLGVMPPGVSCWFKPTQSDSRAWLGFDAGGQRFGERSYFDFNFRKPIALTVNADLKIECSAGLKSY